MTVHDFAIPCGIVLRPGRVDGAYASNVHLDFTLGPDIRAIHLSAWMPLNDVGSHPLIFAPRGILEYDKLSVPTRHHETYYQTLRDFFEESDEMLCFEDMNVGDILIFVPQIFL